MRIHDYQSTQKSKLEYLEAFIWYNLHRIDYHYMSLLLVNKDARENAHAIFVLSKGTRLDAFMPEYLIMSD